jgi:hypothetical protein
MSLKVDKWKELGKNEDVKVENMSTARGVKITS